MVKKKVEPITEAQVLEAARAIVEDAAAFWGLEEGTLTFDQVLKQGVNPLEFDHPAPFAAAIEQLASGLANLQRRAALEADPPADPTEQEAEDAAWAAYEKRVAETTDPDELYKIHLENEQLLAAAGKAEIDERNRRAERSFALREKARKREASAPVGRVEEDRLVDLREPDLPPAPERTSHTISETDPAELYKLWVAQGRPVPGPDGD